MASAFVCLEFKGNRAIDLINGQSTQTVANLTEKNSLLLAFCNPKGRMFGSGRLLLIDQVLHLITPADQAESLLETLTPFLKLSRVSCCISDRPVVLVQDRNSNPGRVSRNNQVVVVNEMGSVSWVIGDANATHSIEADVARIKSGLGFVRSSSAALFIPQQAHYQMLEGISFDKGCYTGQEIIARLEHLSQAKKYLWVYEHEGNPVSPGDIIELDHSLKCPVFDVVNTLTSSVALVLAPTEINSDQLTHVPFQISRQVNGQRPVKL